MRPSTTLRRIPDWLGGAVVGALIALLGFTGKSLMEWRAQVNAERAATVGRLQELSTLLNASHRLFMFQNDQAVRLSTILEKAHPEVVSKSAGFEETFVRLYDLFSPDERQIHGIIRSITQYSMKPVNQAVSEWLKKDISFKTGAVSSRQRDHLAESLRVLELHLMLWESKYQYWIPNDPKHALVYLADEKEHGVGFPTGLDDTVIAVLTELKERWSLSDSSKSHNDSQGQADHAGTNR